MPSERIRESWKEDALFGYQFLNGANPMLLRRSKSLPDRLVVPPEMQDLQTQLEKELQVRTASPYRPPHRSTTLPSTPSPPLVQVYLHHLYPPLPASESLCKTDFFSLQSDGFPQHFGTMSLLRPT